MEFQQRYSSVRLDELPEYRRATLEVLRQPLEDRKISVARTIADLAGEQNILKPHIFEAISYRQLDKMSWGD